jgi:hypothetical protein
MIGVIIIVILLLIVGLWFEIHRELHTFRVTRHFLHLSKLSKLDAPKKIVLLADLHNRTYGEKNEELYRAIRREQPDLILVAGDLIVGKKKPKYEHAQELMVRLPKICPVYYSLGNHEQRIKENPRKYEDTYLETYQEILKQAGVQFLENDGVDLKLDKLELQVHGLELPMQTYQKCSRTTIASTEVVRCVGRADTSKFQILMAHNPVYYEAYAKWGADLVVSGHLHGGIVRIPGFRGVITPQAKLFPKYSGEMTVSDDKAIVVSRGLGTHTVNIRVCNPAELVVIHLLPEETIEKKRSFGEYLLQKLIDGVNRYGNTSKTGSV